MSPKSRFTLSALSTAMLLAACAFAQDAGPEVAFVIAGKTAKAVKPETVVARIEEALGIKPALLELKSQADVKTLLKYKIVVSDTDMVSPKSFQALESYVSGGGYLVAVGEFGRWLDVDEDGRRKPGVDKFAAKESRRLTGCTIRNDGLAIVKMRVLGVNPVLRDFHVNEWIPYPIERRGACALALWDGAVPLAEARFQPAGARRPGYATGLSGRPARTRSPPAAGARRS